MTATAVQMDQVRDASLAVLAALGVNEVEMEVSLMEIDFLVELAQGGEVVPIITDDPAGGFGAPDLWVFTVVPAVAVLLAAPGLQPRSAAGIERAVADVVGRVGSPRARRELPRLLDELRKISLPRPPEPAQEQPR